MAEDTISKPRAKRIRLLSQAAALCCVVAAVAAVLFGIPLLRGSSVTTVGYSPSARSDLSGAQNPSASEKAPV